MSLPPPLPHLPPQADIPQQLATATTAWKKLRRLASYASFDGMTLTFLGALSLICGAYSSADGLFISFALLGTGIFEIFSVRQLRRLKPSSVNHLAFNQLVLATAIIAYAMFGFFQNRHGIGMIAEIQEQLGQSGAMTDDMHSQAAAVIEIWYGALATFAIVVQGGTALIYFSRQKHLKRYLAETPDWIQQMQRERGEVSL